jgi:biopolymer transport protein ExbD
MAFSTTGSSGGEGLSSEISVTPLIDVLLVLLIIFMVIVPTVSFGLDASIPSKTSTGRTDANADRPILVQVEQDHTAVRYRVDGSALEKAELKPRLLDLLSKRSVRQVFLQADAGLDFGVVAGVIDAGRAAGADSVGLLTKGDSSPIR